VGKEVTEPGKHKRAAKRMRKNGMVRTRSYWVTPEIDAMIDHLARQCFDQVQEARRSAQIEIERDAAWNAREEGK
jgi:hypothetical protein